MTEKITYQVAVSVIIPAFNAANTIARSIDSVRAQNFPSLEIIVIDDGSTDQTVSKVKALIQPRENISLITLERNRGVSAARNAGLAQANGKYLAFLDADDIWLPGKLAKQIEAIECDPEVTIVSCNSLLLSPTGERIKEGHVNRPPVQGPDAWKTLLIYNFMPTPTILTRTSLAKSVGGFDESLKVGEDLDLWIRLALRGKIVVLPEIYTCYYDTPGSLMKRHVDKTTRLVLPMLQKHLNDHVHLLSRKEHKYILGNQSFQTGCILFFSGAFTQCIAPFIKAAINGCRPIKSLSYIPRAVLKEIFRKALSKRLVNS